MLFLVCGAERLLVTAGREERDVQRLLSVDWDPDAKNTSEEKSTGNKEDDEFAAEDDPEAEEVEDLHHSRHKDQEVLDHQIAIGLAIMFLGMIFMAGLLAMVIAYPDPQIRHYCVRICSSTVVIFIAIGIQHAALVSTTIGHYTGLKSGWRSVVHTFPLYWCATIYVCFKVRHRHIDFRAVGFVFSHILAFDAIFAGSDLLYKFGYTRNTESKPMWQAVVYRCVLWCIFVLFFYVLLKITLKVLLRLPFTCEVPDVLHHGHGEVSSGHSHEGGHAAVDIPHAEHAHSAVDTPESVAEFIEELYESFEEAGLLALSYLANKFLIYKTTLETYDLKHAQGSYDSRELLWNVKNCSVLHAVATLAGWILLLNLAIVCMDHLLSSIRTYQAVSSFFSMCVAWASMHLCKCVIMMEISEEACVLILTAFAMTPVAGLFVIVADKMADADLITDELADTLVTSYGFMIGFSWEKAYAEASHLLMGDNKQSANGTANPWKESMFNPEFCFRVAMCFALVLVMFPGWRFLILPHALKPVPPREQAAKDCVK